ncbi:MAG: nucleoside triphosphate pyrophosphohydrolase [Myxococcales bacterium]|nr:nucleoside triphosphate pyrophosphohydrolase [Myxococcales bacterium]USN51789.1 MAG: nucleoside triphosphate pyrophosphohydrolase [Myxococcales bacterium]
MRQFKQNKLWRDKAMALLESQGSRVNWRKLEQKEFQQCLKEKLLEESKEVVSASSLEQIVEELADVMEVIEAMAEAYEISMDDIITAKNNKKSKRGGFSDRIYVESTLHPEGSFGEKYCLADPQKYPEIFE